MNALRNVARREAAKIKRRHRVAWSGGLEADIARFALRRRLRKLFPDVTPLAREIAIRHVAGL